MARVNVDSQALIDARFAVLASLMGSGDPDLALGRMVRVWMQCIERETYALTDSVIVALFRGETNAPEWLITAELAERIEGGLRIKGTQGRIEYLAEQRARARQNGVKGGRPRKPTSVLGNNQRRGGSKTSPAPAPALTPALKETPLPPSLDTDRFREVWSAWRNHRREIGHPLKPTTTARQLKMLADLGASAAIDTIEASIQNGWQGLFPEKLNGSRAAKPNLVDQFNASAQAFLANGGQE